MDKNEYRARLDEINALVDRQDYKGALKIVDPIEWRRVRSARTLCMVGEIYEANKRYEDSRKLLLLAHQRAPIGKTVLYRLVEVSVKMGEYEDAVNYYNRFVEICPNDNSRYILKYKICRGRKSPVEEQIAILEEYKSKEYTERWAYELARLYAKAGMKKKCVEECDDLILWFSEGKYVTKAMELKMKYEPLTPSQEEKYKSTQVEPAPVRLARTAANLSAASAAAAKLLQNADTLKREVIPNTEVKKSTPGTMDAPKAMEMPNFIKTPGSGKSVFTPAPEIKMPENLRKEIEEEKRKREQKAAEEEIPDFPEPDFEELLSQAADEMAQSVAEVSEEAVVPDAEEPEEKKTEVILPEEEETILPEEEPEEVVEPEEKPEEVEEQEEPASEETGETIDLSQALEAAIAEVTATEEQTTEEQTEEAAEETRVFGQEMQDAVRAAQELEYLEQTQKTAEYTEAEIAQVTEEMDSTLRHHLTDEEHKRLFTYFAPIPGMKEQVDEALDIVQESASEKTSRSGNIVITGRSGSGKTKFSEGLVKALCKERHMEAAKVAYMDAEEMNKKDPAYIVDKMAGGFLVVEHASAMKPEIVENLSRAMEFKTNRLTVILEDVKQGIYELNDKYPEFMEKFNSKIVIPVFTNDELVSFAKTYSKETGYKIDDMAVLALYTLIGDNQNEENPVAVGQVKEMMDDAIKHAAKVGRRPGRKVAKRHLDETGRIMLYEKDFDV